MEPTEATIDKLAQRREARRRKILENAKERLERLNGNENDVRFSDPEVEPDILPSRQQTVPIPPAAQMDDWNVLLRTLDGGSDVVSMPTKHFLLESRAHIIIAAVIACLVSLWRCHTVAATNNDGIGYSVFLLVGLSIVLELIFYRGQRQLSPIVQLVLSLCGIQIQRVKMVLHFFTTIQSLFIDVGIFIFVFCNLTLLTSCISDRFMDLVSIK